MARDLESRVETSPVSYALSPLQEGMRVALIVFGPADYRLVWSFPHLIIDGRSIGILPKEVFAIYESLVTGEPASLPPAPAYQAFIHWLQRLDQNKEETFRRQQLKSF